MTTYKEAGLAFVRSTKSALNARIIAKAVVDYWPAEISAYHLLNIAETFGYLAERFKALEDYETVLNEQESSA